MNPDDAQALAFRDQLWASLPALLPEIKRLAAADFDGSERQRQMIQVVARVVMAELEFRANETRLEE